MLLALALAAAGHAAAEILRFGDGALPNCAYDCQALYAAQYECGDGDLACFCARVRERICADVCAGESRQVAGWVAGECATSLTPPTPTPTPTPRSTTKASKTTIPTAPPKPSSSSDVGEKADPAEEDREEEEEKDAAVKDPTVAHATAWYPPTPLLNRIANLTRMQVEKILALLPDGPTPDCDPIAAACVLCSLPQIRPATNHSEPSALVGGHGAASVFHAAAAGYGGV